MYCFDLHIIDWYIRFISIILFHKSAIPAYNNAALTQNMVLTDDLMSFANIDHHLGGQTLQLVSLSEYYMYNTSLCHNHK